MLRSDSPMTVPVLAEEIQRLESAYGYESARISSIVSGGTLGIPSVGLLGSIFDKEQSSYKHAGNVRAWYQARNLFISKQLRTSLQSGEVLWDIGAGDGSFVQLCNSLGLGAVAVEPSKHSADLGAQRGLPILKCRLEDLQLPENSIGAVDLFDVIEHLPNPKTILKEVHRVLKAGGKVFFSVPAFPILWSDFDVFSGHFRHFSIDSLVREIAPFFEVDSVRYFFSSLWIPIFLLRAIPYRLRTVKTSKEITAASHRLSPASGTVLEKLLSLESRLGHPRLPGTSIFLAATKSGGDSGA